MSSLSTTEWCWLIFGIFLLLILAFVIGYNSGILYCILYNCELIYCSWCVS